MNEWAVKCMPMVGAGIRDYCLTVKAVRVSSFKADLTASTTISDVEAVCIQQLFSRGTTALAPTCRLLRSSAARN